MNHTHGIWSRVGGMIMLIGVSLHVQHEALEPAWRRHNHGPEHHPVQGRDMGMTIVVQTTTTSGNPVTCVQV